MKGEASDQDADDGEDADVRAEQSREVEIEQIDHDTVGPEDGEADADQDQPAAAHPLADQRIAQDFQNGCADEQRQ